MRQYTNSFKTVHKTACARARKYKNYYHQDIPSSQLLHLLKSQRFLCVYCGNCIVQKPILDHILPVSKGGEHVLANLQFTCVVCNSSKCDRVDRTPLPYKICDLVYPVLDPNYTDCTSSL